VIWRGCEIPDSDLEGIRHKKIAATVRGAPSTAAAMAENNNTATLFRLFVID
jgi:hypothetical protein